MKPAVRLLPILAVIVGAAFGAASGLYIKGVHFSSLAVTGFRMGVPFLVMLPSMLAGKRFLGPPRSRRTLWTASAINALRMLLFVLAYKLTSVGNAVVLLYLWPVFALLIGTARLHSRPSAYQLGLVALSFAGIVVMNLHRGFSLSPEDLLGSLAMILAALGFALTVILFKEALAEVRETDAIFFQNALGAVVFLPVLAVELGTAIAGSAQAGSRALLPELGLGLAYGLTVGVAGFFCFFYAMKRLPIFQYGALAYTEVPIAVILAVLILGEGVVANQLVGAAMVVTASFLAQRARSQGPAAGATPGPQATKL